MSDDKKSVYDMTIDELRHTKFAMFELSPEEQEYVQEKLMRPTPIIFVTKSIDGVPVDNEEMDGDSDA